MLNKICTRLCFKFCMNIFIVFRYNISFIDPPLGVYIRRNISFSVYQIYTTCILIYTRGILNIYHGTRSTRGFE